MEAPIDVTNSVAALIPIYTLPWRQTSVTNEVSSVLITVSMAANQEPAMAGDSVGW